MVFSLYSMVDGLLVSLGVNEYAMSAVNLAIPYTNALFSLAVMFAVGSSTIIAIFLAQNRKDEADSLFSQNFFLLLGVGVLISVVLKMASSALSGSIDTYGAELVSLVGVLLGSFTTGMLVRYGVMLAFGGILLTAYFLLKKRLNNRQPMEYTA